MEEISVYKKIISRYVSWLKSITTNRNFWIYADEIDRYFEGDYRGEEPEVICDAFNDVLSKEGIYVYIEYGTYNKIFFSNTPQIDKSQIEVKENPKKLKFVNRVPLKPWKDPESLFCDTKFLKEFLGKEPRKGKECKDT